jgi:hypothetical protein
MELAPRHVVAMVASVCAAVVLAPVGVMAATGTLSNLVDPYDASRRARVGTNGGLFTENRPRTSSGTFNKQATDVTDANLHVLLDLAAPNKIAVTDFALTVVDDGTTQALYDIVALFAFVRTSGTAPCGGAGWTRTALRTLTVPHGQAAQQTFDSAPLVLPTPATGQRVCLAFQQTRWVGSTRTQVAVSGFTFL